MTTDTTTWHPPTLAELRTVRDTIAAHGHDPITLRNLAALAGLRHSTTRSAVAELARRGLVHIDRRTDEHGTPAPSRYRVVTPVRPDRSRHIDQLMREVPRVGPQREKATSRP